METPTAYEHLVSLFVSVSVIVGFPVGSFAKF